MDDDQDRRVSWVPAPRELAVEELTGRTVRGQGWRLEAVVWFGGAAFLLVSAPGAPVLAMLFAAMGVVNYWFSNTLTGRTLGWTLSRRRRRWRFTASLEPEGLALDVVGGSSGNPWEWRYYTGVVEDPMGEP